MSVAHKRKLEDDARPDREAKREEQMQQLRIDFRARAFASNRLLVVGCGR